MHSIADLESEKIITEDPKLVLSKANFTASNIAKVPYNNEEDTKLKHFCTI